MEALRIKDNSQLKKEIFTKIPNLTNKISNKTLKQLEGEGVFVFPEIIRDAEDISGEQIDIYARCVSVADVFDALVSKRCYKQSWTAQNAREEILSQAGKQFDPSITKLFDEHFDEFLAVMENYPDAP